MPIGDRIGKRRLELKMTQDELAKIAGYASRVSINKIEKSHPKVRAEADKIREIINGRIIGGYVIIGSGAVTTEMGNVRDAKKRGDLKRLFGGTVMDVVELSAHIIARADKLSLLMGLGVMDATHLAAAEVGEAKFLLTTDADFIKKCAKLNLTTVMVINPLEF